MAKWIERVFGTEAAFVFPALYYGGICSISKSNISTCFLSLVRKSELSWSFFASTVTGVVSYINFVLPSQFITLGTHLCLHQFCCDAMSRCSSAVADTCHQCQSLSDNVITSANEVMFLSLFVCLC